MENYVRQIYKIMQVYMGKFNVNDIVGKKFGRLTVLNYDNSKPKSAKGGFYHYYICLCECGRTTQVERSHLLTKHTKSCGCLSFETKSILHKKHGLRKTRINNIWRGMKQRCYNPKRDNYSKQGGLGITICKEWLNDFEAFYNWSITNGYTDNLTIDRINVNGNYEPSNCRWVDKIKQANNKNNIPLYEYNGLKLSIAEWSKVLNINSETLRERIKRGWTIEKTFSTIPKKFHNPK